MIIKCKMCGGDINFTRGDTSGVCEYCGSTSTIPKVDDEQRLNRFNRANHFRRLGEFDKAIAAYEKILDEDDTDAEAHWGIVLSRYGIEYVEDPSSKKRIPTCHRVQIESILTDADYQAALKYAPDALSRDLYEKQANEISDIQKGILLISRNEEPYDVFICYKETDENGQRTHDSQWAQDVYYGLTEQGYKVFFSRITLEDKLGQEYEPYIFAALNSAKVMVVIGSKPEYFNSVWVKNEWSRYLSLMAHDRKKLLIPCYREMDPYDLPEELSNLQSQDMSKIGFMQDLIRGVRKVLGSEKPSDQSHAATQVSQPVNTTTLSPGVNSLMDRTWLFMEDGDFESASDYLNRVLDLDPKYAPAYAAKVCVTLHLHKEADLAETTFKYEDNPDWQKALRFANQQQKETYEGYSARVKDRIDTQIRNYAYDCALEMAVNPTANIKELNAELTAYASSCTHPTGRKPDGNRRPNGQKNEEAFDTAVTHNEPGDTSESNLLAAAATLEAIKDTKASERAKQCKKMAEIAHQKQIYNNAFSMYTTPHQLPSKLEEAAKDFSNIPEYKDAKKLSQACHEKAEFIRANLYESALHVMEAASDSSQWAEAKDLLNNSELNGYRDTAQLRTIVENKYKECVTAEKEAIRLAEEKKRREEKEAANIRAAKKKKSIIIVSILAIIMLTVNIIMTRIIKDKIYLMHHDNLYDNCKLLEDSKTF